ncbi:hypothetical protein DSCW_26830 [Desulfosarcina widdelii]|uniref:Phospholipase C/D domain-containing protein n=1 Tax=Desulfosarcina widdelii TaxID=947919 RepID=A0A5K7Z0Q2_9BACT|nr:hypothetical protein [Desulfosarcina widdelii]BBO75266.1 hypothetical protein DSCW_26830 [Desulfosarcina widdelii]
MALPATHIRFAAVLSAHLSVTDRSAYLSGTLYPDSRWMTGLERGHTHDRRFLEPDFASDDFSLGWHIHCVCDHIQSDIHNDLLGNLSQLPPDERWIRVSAARAVQDANDAARGEMFSHLLLLTDNRTPNGESAEGVSAYLELVGRVYSRTVPPVWSDYEALWAGVGLDRQRISQIEEQVKRIMGDESLVNNLYDAFQQMVHRWHRPTVAAKQAQRRRK